LLVRTHPNLARRDTPMLAPMVPASTFSFLAFLERQDQALACQEQSNANLWALFNKHNLHLCHELCQVHSELAQQRQVQVWNEDQFANQHQVQMLNDDQCAHLRQVQMLNDDQFAHLRQVQEQQHQVQEQQRQECQNWNSVSWRLITSETELKIMKTNKTLLRSKTFVTTKTMK
jgi:hypothetical protein